MGVCAMRHVPSAESPELRAINREQIAAGRKQGANSKAQRPETADADWRLKTANPDPTLIRPRSQP